MPKGGKRAGAGRPRGALNKRHRVIVDDPSALMPVEWMLAVLRDPECEQSRRDQMAIQAAPYLHPRLNAVATSNVRGGEASGDVNILQIYAIPRGALIDKSGKVTIDGTVLSELPSITPYEGTPALSDQREKPAPIGPSERLPIVEMEPANVTRLDQYRDKDD